LRRPSGFEEWAAARAWMTGDGPRAIFARRGRVAARAGCVAARVTDAGHLIARAGRGASACGRRQPGTPALTQPTGTTGSTPGAPLSPSASQTQQPRAARTTRFATGAPVPRSPKTATRRGPTDSRIGRGSRREFNPAPRTRSRPRGSEVEGRRRLLSLSRFVLGLGGDVRPCGWFSGSRRRCDRPPR